MTLGGQVTEQVSHANQLVEAIGQAPQREHNHPLPINPDKVGALPYVGWGELPGNRVVGTEQDS